MQTVSQQRPQRPVLGWTALLWEAVLSAEGCLGASGISTQAGESKMSVDIVKYPRGDGSLQARVTGRDRGGLVWDRET